MFARFVDDIFHSNCWRKPRLKSGVIDVQDTLVFFYPFPDV
jgi:hypothetical protein